MQPTNLILIMSAACAIPFIKVAYAGQNSIAKRSTDWTPIMDRSLHHDEPDADFLLFRQYDDYVLESYEYGSSTGKSDVPSSSTAQDSASTQWLPSEEYYEYPLPPTYEVGATIEKPTTPETPMEKTSDDISLYKKNYGLGKELARTVVPGSEATKPKSSEASYSLISSTGAPLLDKPRFEETETSNSRTEFIETEPTEDKISTETSIVSPFIKKTDGTEGNSFELMETVDNFKMKEAISRNTGFSTDVISTETSTVVPLTKKIASTEEASFGSVEEVVVANMPEEISIIPGSSTDVISTETSTVDPLTKKIASTEEASFGSLEEVVVANIAEEISNTPGSSTDVISTETSTADLLKANSNGTLGYSFGSMEDVDNVNKNETIPETPRSLTGGGMSIPVEHDGIETSEGTSSTESGETITNLKDESSVIGDLQEEEIETGLNISIGGYNSTDCKPSMHEVNGNGNTGKKVSDLYSVKRPSGSGSSREILLKKRVLFLISLLRAILHAKSKDHS